MKIKILAILSILLIGNSCTEDQIQTDFFCEKEGRFLGDLPLSEEINALLPYVVGKSLVFIDSLGNEIVFEEVTPMAESAEERIVRTVCGGSWLDVHEFDYFIEHRKTARYFCDEIRTDLYFSIFKSYLEITDTSFVTYDYFSVNVDWSYMQLGYMDNGSDISEYQVYLAEDLITESIGDTILFGNSFTNVIKSKFTEYPIFYSKTTGIAAFKSHDDVLWVFDRME